MDLSFKMSSSTPSHTINLSYGGLQNILDGVTADNVVLQVLGYKEIPGGNGTRFRLLLNDGVNLFAYAILATHLNNLIYDKKFEKYTVFKLKNYLLTEIGPDKKVIICTAIDVLILGLKINVKIEKSDSGLSENHNNTSVSVALSIPGPSQSSHYKTSNSIQEKYNTENVGIQNEESHPVSLCLPHNTPYSMNSLPSTSNDPQIKFKEANNKSKDNQNDSSILVSMSGLKNNENFNSELILGTSNADQIIIKNAGSKASCIGAANKSPVSECYLSIQLRPFPTLPDVSQNWDIAGNNRAESPNKSQNYFICSISNISPYNQKWKIKARIVYKTHVVSYNNLRGQGKFFSIFLLDDSGEIKATAFNQNTEKFFESLEVNKIYLITNASVKPARENSVNCDYELIIENNTNIELSNDDDESIPFLSFNFHTIIQIMSSSINSYIDVIGIVMYISDITSLITKSNKEVVKKNFILFDNCGKSIAVTLWGSDAQNLESNMHDIIAIKNAKVSSFKGVASLTVTSLSRIYINPQIPESVELKEWFQNLNHAEAPKLPFELSIQMASQNWKTIADACFGNRNSELPTYYNIKATIVMIKKEKTMYQACAFPGCLKKLINLNNGFYKCNKCNKDYDSFTWRFMLPLEIADFTGSQWTIAFTETAEDLIGMNSEDLSYMKREDEDKFDDILCSLNLKSYVFKMRSNKDTFLENGCLKPSILDFNRIEPISYCKKLLADIKKMSTISSRK